MKTPKTWRIALLFDANKTFDREVMEGIAAHLASTRVAWDLFLEEDFRMRLPGIDRWRGHGVIANFDDPDVAPALRGCSVPVVAVGGSHDDPRAYPAGMPYVATDNRQLVKLARDHLIDAGLQRFAMYSQPEADDSRWAQERERAFAALMAEDRMDAPIFRGCATHAASWDAAVQGQVAWLRSLPKPVGIVAVTDARARQLLQACAIAGIAVPDDVAVVGIDNDPLVGMLTRLPLSSVMHGTQDIGRTAAHLLEQMLYGVRLGEKRIVVPPAGLHARESSHHRGRAHPHVMRACHYIRQYACDAIRTRHVAAYVGLSRSALEGYFRQELGCTVHEAILRARLDAAKAGLRNAARSIADVALGCGFTSTQYMHLVFKRELGCTPRAWRERVLGTAPPLPAAA